MLLDYVFKLNSSILIVVVKLSLNRNTGMVTRIYVRASTKEQDAHRALDMLKQFAKGDCIQYVENESGTKLDRPELNRLLDEADKGDTLLVESVDRLSRLTQSDFEILKQRIKEKGLKLVIHDLPTTHILNVSDDPITSTILNLVNGMLIDLLATMARLDNDKRIQRIKQGLKRSGYKPTGKKADTTKHNRIIELSKSNMSKEEIARAVKCSISTVYRVLSESSNS